MAAGRAVPETALVTGSSGFIGSAVIRALLEQGVRVRALLEPGREPGLWPVDDVEIIMGDVRDAAAVDRAVADIETVFHLAAIYRFWAPDPELFYDVNVRGTQNLLRSSARASCRRVVYTSTVATLGVATADELASEETLVHFEHLFGHYKRSKYMAEHEVLRAGARGLPVVLVHPTFPVGPGDRAPTPTGRTIVEFLNGRIPAYVDTALNIAHVDDVARGHVQAAALGTVGHSYVLGGENVSLYEMLAMLADLCGFDPPSVRLTPRMVLPIVRTAEWFEARVLRREPTLPSEPVRMATTRMAYDDSLARAALGYTSRPARDALAEAVRWYVDEGFVKPQRIARMEGAPALRDAEQFAPVAP